LLRKDFQTYCGGGEGDVKKRHCASVQAAAISRIIDENTLISILQQGINTFDEKCLVEAAKKLNDSNTLKTIVSKLKKVWSIKTILDDVHNEKKIACILAYLPKSIEADYFLYKIKHNGYEHISFLFSALRKVKSMELLAEIALNTSIRDISYEAYGKLTDQQILKDIVLTASSEYAREKAISNITDQEFLLQIALNDSSYTVTKYAVNNIESLHHLLILIKNSSSDYIINETLNRIHSKFHDEIIHRHMEVDLLIIMLKEFVPEGREAGPWTIEPYAKALKNLLETNIVNITTSQLQAISDLKDSRFQCTEDSDMHGWPKTVTLGADYSYLRELALDEMKRR